MATLYVTEQNSVIRKSGNRLIVQKEDNILLEVQCHKIDAVLIFGNVQFTTQVVHELFEHGIEMAILTRTGKLIGQITSPATRNITLRIHQFKKYLDDDFKSRLSKQIVAGKIRNCLNVVRLFSYNHPEIDFEAETNSLRTRLEEIEYSPSVEQLLGIEGSAARIYFKCFGRMLLVDFNFLKREKHPPPDPVNALLSLSYTMVFNEILSLLDGLGFDPYLGFFHHLDYGRASLASDLLEEFRAPIADRLVLHLLNNRILKKEDFYPNLKTGGVYLKHQALKRYFVEYESFLNHEFVHPYSKEKTNFRKCFRIQAEAVASSIKNVSSYIPFQHEL